MAEDILNLNFQQPNPEQNAPVSVDTENEFIEQGVVETPNFTLTPPSGGFTPTSIPSVDVDFDAIRDQLFVPGSGEPIRTSPDPSVIKGAEQLANTLNYNPVVMDYPYNMDPNSELFNSDTYSKAKNDDPLGNTLLDFDDPAQSAQLVSNVDALQPLKFGIKATNYDRYNAPGFKHLFNKIGFHPYIDNETIYNANSTWWDENARMRGQWGRIFSTGFMSTYDAIGDLLTGEYTSADTDGAAVFEDAMRIGNSSKGGIGGFTNNLMLNSGYTFGILANIAVEELALAGLEAVTLGGATPVVASRTAYNMVRLGKAVDKSADMLRMANSSAKLTNKLNDAATARSFWQNAGRWTLNTFTPNTYKAIKNSRTTQNTAKALSLWAKTAKTAGGFYRDARMFNLAMAESKLEAGLVQNKMFNDLFHEYVAKFGERPVGEDLEKIERTSQESAFTALMWNMPIIFFSNRLVLGTALRGFRGMAGIFGKSAGSTGNRWMRKSAKTIAKETAKGAAREPIKLLSKNRFKRMLQKGFAGNLRDAGASILRYSSANLAEGFQELAQEAIAVGAEDYYKALYNDPAIGGLDAQMASIWSGVNSQMSGQGFEVFMSGFLMGGLVQGPQRLVFNGLPNLYHRVSSPEEFAKQKEQEEEYIKEAVKTANEMYNDPMKYFDPNKINAMFQKEASQDMLDATYTGDIMSFLDKKNAAIFNNLYTAAELGMLSDFSNMMDDFGKLDDAALAEAISWATEEEIKSGKVRERIKEMSEKADEMRKAYDKLNEEIINPFDPKLFKADTREYREEALRWAAFDHAKKLAMFAREQFKNSADRISSMYSELSSDPIIAKMAANDIDVLTDIQALISEINFLKNEIDIATKPTIVVEEREDKEGKTEMVETEKIPELTAEEKKALKFKQDKLIALQNVFNVLTDQKNVERGVFSDAELEKIENLEDRAKEKNIRDKKVKIIEDLRQQILSTEVDRDAVLEAFVNQLSGKNLESSFGEFNIEHKDKFKKVFEEYLNLLSDQMNEEINSDQIDTWVDKILDGKALTQRQQILSKAVRTILAPENLIKLAERIEPRFRRLFIENKNKVEARLREYLKVTKTNLWLNELSGIGVWPEYAELVNYLDKKGKIPTTYYTEEGQLNESSAQWERASYIISAQENLTKEKEKKAKDPEEAEEDIDYEENFMRDEENLEDLEEQQQGPQEGDLFVKQKYIEYVKERSANNKKYLQFSDWVKDKSSKNARKQAVAVEDIHQQVYSPLYLKNKKLPEFYEWLKDQSDNQKVIDILLFRNVSFYDINKESTDSTEFNESTVKKGTRVTKHKKSGINITERTVVDKETGKKKKVYYHTDNNNNPVGSDTYLTKSDAVKARNKKVKEKKAIKTFDFGKFEGISRGTILIKDGVLYTVRSTPEMVNDNDNLYIKEVTKEKSRSSKDRIFLTREQANEYKLANAQDIKYIKDTSKLKLEEAVKVNPTYDRSIKNRQEQVEDGVKKQQDLLRNLSPTMMGDLKLRVSRGGNFKSLSIPIDEKENFRFGDKNPNVKIKKNAQKLSIEIYDENGSYGYFQGPETVLFTDGQNNIISPFELNESTIHEYFDIPNKMSSSDALSIIQDNYSDAYYIYQLFEKDLNVEGMIEVNIKDYPQLMVKLSEGSLTRSKSNPLITFDSLDTMFISEDTSITTDGEKAYFIMDYNRRYERPKNNKEKMKVQGAPITNIDQNTKFFENLMLEVDQFEEQYDVLNRMGKYIAFVKLPNGKSAFIGLTAPIYKPEDFNTLLVEMQERAAEVADNNVNDDGTVKNKRATKDINDKIANTIYLAAEPGVYVELGVANDGQLVVNYTNMNLSKRSKKRSARGYVGHDEFMGFKDVQELITRLNSFIKPVYPAGFKLDSIKTSIEKGEQDISILGTLETRFTPEIKNNFRLELRTNPNVVSKDQRIRNATNTNTPESTETKDTTSPKPTLTAEQKRNIIKGDYQNVDPNYALNIVRRMHNGEDINEFDQSILDNIEGPVLAAYLIQVQTEGTKDITNTSGLLNQNYQGISFKADENLKEFTNRYWDQRYQEIKGANPNISDSDIIDVIKAEMEEIKNNPENPLYSGYQTLKKIQEDAEGKAFKITDNFDGNSIEDINVFTNWFKENLNTDEIKLNVVDNLYNNMVDNQMIVGQFMLYIHNLKLAGEVTVGTNNPFKYHEAFHAVFRMFLTEKEIKAYLKAAKKDVLAKLRKEGKTLSNELASMRKKHALYAKMSRKELEERYLEEFMADQFEFFKMNPKSAKVSSEVKSLFQRIIDFIKSILGFPKYKLNSLYKDIDSGKYKNAGIQENRFTTSAMTQPSTAYKSLTLGTKKVKEISDSGLYFKEINNYMPSDDQHTLVSMAASLFAMRKTNASKVDDVATLLDGAINDVIETYNPDRQFYKDKGFIWYKDNLSRIENYYDSLRRQKDEFKNLVRLRLEEINSSALAQQEELEEQEAELGDITTEQWDKTAEMMGGFASAPKIIRELFGMVTIKDQDMFGNKTILENKKEPIVVGVNYNKVYDSVLKATANEPNAQKRLKKLWVWSQGSNVQTRAVVKEMFRQLGILKDAETGILFDPAEPFPSMRSESGVRATLYNAISNQFENYTTPYLLQLIDSKTGVVQIFEANKADDAHHTLVQWAESFNRKYQEIRIVGSKENKAASRALGRLVTFLSYKTIPQNLNLVDESITIADQIFETTGMKFDSNFILFSLYNRLEDLNVQIPTQQRLLFEMNTFVDPITADEVNEIVQSLNAGENLFLNNQELDTEDVDEATDDITQYYEGGVKGRLRKIALNNSYFDESVGASTFINEEGNTIYGHQRPTYHLREVARMSSEENYIENRIQEDPFLEDNFLFNDPKFEEMQKKGQVRLFRMSGQKVGVANLTAEGIIKENKGYNKANRKGTKYGSFTPQQFIVALINNYTSGYNRVNPEKSLIGSYKDPNTNRPVEFAIAPTLIRVIEASNTGDLAMLPVHKMITIDNEGRVELTNEAKEAFKNIIKRDAKLIQNELNPETETEANIIGGNSNSRGERTNEGRLYKLSHNGRKLLSVLKRRKRNIKFYKDPFLGEETKKAIRTGRQSVMLAGASATSSTQLLEGSEGLVDFTIIDTQPISLLMKNEGLINIEDLSMEEVEKLIKEMGPYVTKEKVSGKKQHAFTVYENTYYTYGFEIAEFFRGKVSLTKFSFKDPINDESTDVKITEDKTGQVSVDINEIDTTPVETFEQLINEGLSFDEAWKAIDGDAVMMKRLFDEASELISLLKDFRAINKISPDISTALGVVMDQDNGTIINDIDIDETQSYMDLYNLKVDNLPFNLTQIFLNDYINTIAINDALLGDQRLSLKDAIDAIKRAKMQNASGASAYSDVIAPELGIDHSNENIDMLLYNDSTYQKEFANMFESDKQLEEDPGERGDGQMLITTKAFRYMNFGFGELTPQMARVISLIEQGKEVELNQEFFGSLTTESYKQLGVIMNSQKLVYSDGKVYLKMSAFTLSPLLTSKRDDSGNFTIPIPGREKLHNLRIKLEAWENENNTIAIAVPRSASKMMKANMLGNREAFDNSTINSDNITRLSSKDMRKQMVVPSNKIEIVDPRQIKNLITSEQDLNTDVLWNGMPMKLKDVVDLYHQAQGNKLAISWFAKRNLVFNFEDVLNDFTNTNEGMTINLSNFLKFAIGGLKSAKAKSDMLSYFELNEDGTGDPNFNLNNQLTRKKFQTLFMSFLSKGTLAARQPGISAALVSDDGMLFPKKVKRVDENGTPIEWEVLRQAQWAELEAEGKTAVRYTDESLELHTGLKENDYYFDRLRSDVMMYNEDGTETGVVYTESVIPPHFASILQNLPKNAPIPKELAMAYGIRIPSQDKHSAVNVMFVDFLPVYYGSSAMFARELVELSGADFDIDKLYMQIKSFFVDKGKFVEYGNAKTEEELFGHYIRYNILEAKKKGTPLREEIDKYLESNPELKFNLNEWNDMTEEEIDVLNQSEVILKIGMEGMGLPVSLEEYKEYKEKYNGREPYTAAIDNQILDLKFMLQGNRGMIQPRNGRLLGVAQEPANLRPLTDENAAKVLGVENAGVWDFIKKNIPQLAEIVSEEDIDIDNLRGKLLSFKANKEGEKNIGASVSPNLYISIAKEFGVEVRSKKFEGEETIPALTIDDYEYRKFVDYTIDPVTLKQDVKDGYRTQYVISALITAMTDNAKERLADKLGLNKQALAMVTTMTGMGVDITTSILLMNQPIIRSSFFDAINKDEPTDPGIRAILEKKGMQILSFFNNRDLGIPKTKVTRKLLEDMANRPDATIDLSLVDEESINEEFLYELSEELSVITQFLIIYDQTESLRNVSILLNLQKAFGEDLFSIEEKQKAAENLGFLMTKSEWAGSAKNPNKIPFDFRPVFMQEYATKPSMHITSYKIFREAYDYIFPKLFLEASNPFNDLKNLMLNNMTNMFNQKDQDVLVNNITAFLNTLAYMTSIGYVSEDTQDGSGRQTTQDSLNNALIYNGKNYGNPNNKNLHISQVFERLIKNKKNYNYFLDDFLSLKEAANEDNWTGIDKVIANNFTQLSDADTTRVQNSFLDLYSDPDTHIDAVALVHYLLVKDGFTKNNRGTFIDFLPAEIKKDILNSIDSVQTLFNSDTATNEAYKRVFGMTQNQLREYLAINYLKSTSAQWNVPVLDRKTSKNEPSVEIFDIESEEVSIEPNVKTILPYTPKGDTIIEDQSESSHLSITAPKQFKYLGKVYYSIDHAYQVNKSGKFNKAADKDYQKKKKEGKIGGYSRNTKGKEDLALLTLLTKRASLVNLNRYAGDSDYMYGELLTSATDFTTIGMKEDLSVAFIKGLKAAQKEVIWTKIMFGENAGDFVYNTRTKLKNLKKEGIDSKKDVFVVDVDKGLVTVAMYAGLPIYYDNKIKTVRGQFSKVNQQAKEVKKQITSNLQKLALKGFRSEKVLIPYRGGKNKKSFLSKQQLVLPLIARKVMSDGRVVLLQLVRYQTDGKYQTEAELSQLLSEGQTKVTGNYAEYKIIEGGPEGSKDQNPIGFLYGERPTELQIQKFENAKREAFDLEMEDVDNMDIEIPETEDPTDVDFDLESDDIVEDDTTMEDASSLLMQLQNKRDSILEDLESDTNQVLTNFYYNLNSDERVLLENEGITDLNSLIEAYDAYPNDINKFVEHIRKCYFK